MQKVIIVAEWLKPSGGVSRSLLEILRAIDPDDYEVTLLLMHDSDEMLSEVPAHVRVLGEQSKLPYLSATEAAREVASRFGIPSLIAFVTSFVSWKLTANRRKRFAFFTKRAGALTEVYDVAVAYAMLDAYSNQFVADCVNSHRRIMWCHTDPKLYIGQSMGGMGQVFAKFDRINCVGASALESFANAYPELEDRLKVAHNLVDSERLKQMAASGIEGARPTCTVVCTVARLSFEKGIDLLVRAAALLRIEGYEFIWWVIGPSSDPEYLAHIRELVVENDLVDQVQLLGQKPNPYPYMAECDIYVQPSRVEGYCGATIEAKILKRPVIRTATPDAFEQFDHGVDGSIVALDATAIYEELRNLIDRPEIGANYGLAIKTDLNDGAALARMLE